MSVRTNIRSQKRKPGTAGADDSADLREHLAQLDEELSHLSPHDYDRFLLIAGEMLALARRLDDRYRIALVLMRMGDCYRRLERFEEAMEHLQGAYAMFGELGIYPMEHARTAYYIGNVYYAYADYPSALEYYEHAVALGDRAGNRIWAAAALSSIGDTYRFLGDLPKALDVLARALTLWDQLGDRMGAAVAWNNIGIIHCDLKDGEEGGRAYRMSLDLYREAGHRPGEALALSNLALTVVKDHFDKGIGYLVEALAIHRELGNRRNEAGTLGHIGRTYLEREEPLIALDYLRNSLEMYISIGFVSGQVDALGYIGKVYLAMGQPECAREYLDQALALAQTSNYRMAEYEAHQVLADVHERLGDVAKSLEHFKAYVALRDEVRGEETKKTIAAMQMRVDLERAEKEKEIYRLKAAQLEEEMERKSRELTSMALHLAQKSEYIAGLNRMMKELGSRQGEHSGDITRALRQHIDGEKYAEGEWQRFERQFNEVHPGFMKTLLDSYPALTPAELKVCSLLRINISTKEIATLLNSTPRTVEKHRQHIRKKLALPNDANLITFLAGL